MPNDAGVLTERVVLQAMPPAEGARDDYGAPAGSFSDVDEFWAAITARDETEETLENRQITRTNYTVVCRYRDDVDTTMRLWWKSADAGLPAPKTFLYIESVLEIGDDLKMKCNRTR